MKHILPFTLLTACAGADVLTIEPEADAAETAPILFRIVDQPTLCANEALDFALDVAIARWRSATCLPIERSSAAPHRWSWALDVHMTEPSRIAQTTGPWTATKTLLRADIMCPDVTGSYDQVIRSGTHEMWHTLGRYNGHIENDGIADSGGGGDWNRLDAPIDEAALDRVCAVQSCACYHPED